MKNCDLGLEHAARGRRPRAAFSRPRSQFFTIRTSQPANNIYIFYCPHSNLFWKDCEQHALAITKQNKVLNLQDIIIGIIDLSSCPLTLWDCGRKSLLPCIEGFKFKFQIKYQIENTFILRTITYLQFIRSGRRILVSLRWLDRVFEWRYRSTLNNLHATMDNPTDVLLTRSSHLNFKFVSCRRCKNQLK